MRINNEEGNEMKTKIKIYFSSIKKLNLFILTHHYRTRALPATVKKNEFLCLFYNLNIYHLKREEEENFKIDIA